ncbi:MAG: DUF72 domain-containing protein [Breznakibacter sp.]
MEFGRVESIENINFTLPSDHVGTPDVLLHAKEEPLSVYVGCAKWNKNELKGFYPRGTKDELAYYATQFNSIELNATFYQMPHRRQIEIWRDKTPDGFCFFPKIPMGISHFGKLGESQALVDEYCDNIAHFNRKLGMVFLQMHENYGYKNVDQLEYFIKCFPKAIPLAVELRHPEWFSTPDKSETFYRFLQTYARAAVIVDTAGRRDLLHMRLTIPVAFIRFVGANVPHSDRVRLDNWVERLSQWVGMGLRRIYFFVHQNTEEESPWLSAYFIEKLNARLGLRLKKPRLIPETGLLF